MIKFMNTELLEMFDTNTKPFNETTPNGNNIRGKILLNHGGYHGSLLITRVNDELTLQFIRGFPKIKYYDGEMPLDEVQDMVAYEKLDGTCIGFYQLKNNNGEVIEIVPKSRQRAVLDEHFREMLKHCPTYLLYNKRWSPVNPDIIFCEMFGMLNEHTIPHKQTYIDLRLIGASRKKNMLPTDSLEFLSHHFQIPLPRRVATIKPTLKTKGLHGMKVYGYNINYQSNQFDMGIDTHVHLGQEIMDTLKTELDDRNKLYKESHNTIYYEGVVVQNCYDGYNHYIKVKPDSFYEAEGKTELKIPVNEIRKEVMKIINENLTDFSREYDEGKAITIIRECLSEEYDREDVEHNKTTNIIKKELHKYIDSITDKSINRIVDELLGNSIDYDIKQLMRTFAEEYPLQKHRSGDVYFVLEKRIRKEEKGNV